ncbi:AAA family ATPase [Novosphingobium rhizosphaerae]|uniref:AAA family ATPase n=1 Tax=Novosphingobium rhizosphaerae TaxID=1551649 RepID=UPI003D8169BB
MSEVLAGDAEVIIVDEPEAFLHPGLAYKLGREICLNIGEGKQFFAATHSPHFLMGCLSTGMSINIVRLTHHAGKGTTRLLPASELSQMMNDPLLRSVGVVSALFYEAAIITEADADRAFYEEINNRLNLYSKNGVNHALFLNAHNKQTAAEIAFQLRKVGVPAAIILDLDWIKEDGQVCKKYLDSAGIPESIRDGFRSIRKNIRDRLNLKDPNYKRNGGINILEGNEFISAEYFFDQMDDYGLFTVRLGELEQWLKYLNCSKNKSLWLSEIFSSIGSDPTSPNYLKPQNGDV